MFIILPNMEHSSNFATFLQYIWMLRCCGNITEMFCVIWYEIAPSNVS